MRSPSSLRDQLLSRFHAVRAATEALAAPLSPEDQQLQSMASCSPTKWHRAHTTWFFEELVLGPRGQAPFDPSFAYLFNSYYEALGPRHPRPSRGLLSRPSCDEIAAYRRSIDARMLDLLGGADEPTLRALEPTVELGLAHEEQHQELILTDVLHAFAQHPGRPAYRGRGAPVDARPPGGRGGATFVEHAGGLREIGHDPRAGFAFDNEGPRHKVWLEPFALASRPISNGDVRAFAEAGGYREPRLWLSEGLDFVRAGSIEAPGHTRFEGGRTVGFSLDGEVELDEDAPAAHLSFFEADAIARFLGGRLPTEAEWEVATAGQAPDEGNFREDGWLRPRRGEGPATDVRQAFGDVWEWTSSAYAPYPGFAPAAGAASEYNGKFMVSQVVLRGGSCFTPRGHVRGSYRNFWHPDTRFQVSGARVAKEIGG